MIVLVLQIVGGNAALVLSLCSSCGGLSKGHLFSAKLVAATPFRL
jgi:hypothetical protein